MDGIGPRLNFFYWGRSPGYIEIELQKWKLVSHDREMTNFISFKIADAKVMDLTVIESFN